jgi:hypothetical protein
MDTELSKKSINILFLLDNSYYNWNIEVEVQMNSLISTELACIEFVLYNQGNRITEDRIELIMAKFNYDSYFNVRLYLYFRDKYFKLHKFKEIIDLKTEFILSNDSDIKMLIIEEVLEIQEKIFKKYIDEIINTASCN